VKPKPQSNYKPNSIRDDCQTPPEAVASVVYFLRKAGISLVWEPCTGEGLIAQALREAGLDVVETDLQTGQDFETCEKPVGVEAIVTNPPFSAAAMFAGRCKSHGLPWALLLKDDAASASRFRAACWSQEIIRHPTYQKIIPSRRISFKMPKKGWFTHKKDKKKRIIGISNNAAQFHTYWYCAGFNLPYSEIETNYEQVKRLELAVSLGAVFVYDDDFIRAVPGPDCSFDERQLNKIIDLGSAIINPKIAGI